MSGLIFLKLAIWIFDWSIGMFGDGACFFKFSISGLVTLDRSKCVHTLKLDAGSLGYGGFQTSMQHGSLLNTIYSKVEVNNRGKCTAHWLQINENNRGL